VWDAVGGMRVHGRVNDRALERDGRAVVFIHGLGMSTRYMEPTMRALARDFAVSALDLPGFGESRLHGRILSLSGLAEVLRDWLRVRGIEAPVLVGNSHGCQVIVESVVRSGTEAAALVLDAPTMPEGRRSMWAQLVRVAMDTPREPLSLVPHVVRDYLRAGPRRVLATLADALADRLEDKLPRVQIPTTIVCGARDPVSPPVWGERLASITGAAVEGSAPARLRVVAGVAHAMPFSHPAVLGAEIVAVVGRLESPGLGA
jgi:pimeloyl-ACP methyl ester carboxylesterase